MNILDKRASNPAAALDGTELVYVAQLGADAVTTVQDIQYFAKTKLGAASSTADGYLTSTDWTTFNGKQEPLADVITANTYGSSTQYPIVTVNAKGIVTGVTLQTVAPTFSDSAFRIQDNDDATKQIAFEASGIATATTRTWTAPNTDINLGNLSAVATTNGNVLSGTRNRILGGSSNTVSGTDNVVVTGTSNTLGGEGQVNITGNFTTDVTWNGAVIVALQAGAATYLQTVSVTTALTGATLWGTHLVTACTTGGAYSAATVPKSYLSLYATTGGTQTFSSMAVHTLTILGRTANVGGSTVNSGYRFAGKRMVVVSNTGGTVTVTTTTLGTDYNPAGAVTMSITDDAGKLNIAPFFTSEGADSSSSLWNVLVESVYTTL